MLNYVIFLSASYLIGSLSPSYLICKYYYAVDIRCYGSNNPGSTNVLRVVGPKAALVVFLLDLLKGLIVVALAKLWGGNILPLLCGIAVVIGHNWSIFLKFKGGKGIATSLGVILGVAPAITPFVFLVGIAMIFLFRYVSLGSITAAISLPVLLYLFDYSGEYLLFGLALTGMSLYRHRTNIKRLLKGTESKIGQKAKYQ